MLSTPKRALRLMVALAAVGVLAPEPARAQTAAKPAPRPVTAAAPAEVAPAAPASAAEIAAVRKAVEQKFPGAPIKGIIRSPYFGLFEVQFDDQIIYTDAKVAYVVVGSIYDASTKQNLTEDRLRKLNRVAWDSLPLDLAIKRVKGNGSRKLVVFSDADCPFCARLEKELKNVDDVTIYTFLYPIDQLHPDAARKSKMIWCAPDRLKAWDDFYGSGKLPDNKGDCETPLPTLQTLGQKLKVNATPTLVFADGSIVPGALPKDRIELEFLKAAAEAGAAPSAPKK
jgi:thiol:disulfide interchange protein DsbC